MSDKGRTQVVRGTLELTDQGLETPKRFIGYSGQVTLHLPDIKMQATVRELPEYNELVVFPQTDKDGHNDVPERHVRFGGHLYEIVDNREVDECPECGSDSVDATADPVKCYDCEHEFRREN
jgi:hypothetical protein